MTNKGEYPLAKITASASVNATSQIATSAILPSNKDEGVESPTLPILNLSSEVGVKSSVPVALFPPSRYADLLLEAAKTTRP